MTIRSKIVANCAWAVKHTSQIFYTEGPLRAEGEKDKPFTLPLYADCSMFCADIYEWADAPDPLGMHYDGTGYTGTEISADKEIALSQVQPGDLIVYGPGTGWHTAIIVEAGIDPLTCSHGGPNGPSYVHVSQDGRLPQRYFRVIPPNPPPLPKRFVMKLAAIIAHPIIAAFRIKPSPFIAKHPGGGLALVNLSAKTWQGIPNPQAAKALEVANIKHGNAPASFWTTSKQVAW